MADISAVPGTGRTMEILVQLIADPGALGAAGATWTAAGTAATSMGDVVAAKASALDGAWDGAGADAVVGYANQLRTALDAVEPVAKTVSDALVHAEQALTAAHSAVEAITDRVHTAVVALPTQRGDPAGALNHETAVAEIVGPAVGEAENALNTAVSALRDATGQITAACGSTPLHSLPPISAQPFEPAQFTATAWQAHSASDADIASQGAGAAPTSLPRRLAALVRMAVSGWARVAAAVQGLRPVTGDQAVVAATWAAARPPAVAAQRPRRCSSGSTRPSRSSGPRVSPWTR